MVAEQLTTGMEMLRLRLARTPVPAWWATASTALLELLPTRWRAALARRRNEIGLALSGQAIDICRLAGGQLEALDRWPSDAPALSAELHARLEAGGVPRWLLLAPEQVLRRQLSLPLAAESRLREVLAHEIDRQTPFTVDQVQYAGRVLARDPGTRQMQVELVVLPQQRLDAALKALGPLAQDLAGVDVRIDAQHCLGVNLLPSAARQRRHDPTQRLQLELLAASVILVFGALLLSLNNRSEALAALRAQVEQANTDVRQVRALRNQLQASTQAANFLASRRASQPTMLELLVDLTRRIPDNTALDKLAVNDGRVVLVGLSDAPAALPALLQPSALLDKPALAGAVQTDARSGRNRFTLTATVRTGAAEASDARR